MTPHSWLIYTVSVPVTPQEASPVNHTVVQIGVWLPTKSKKKPLRQLSHTLTYSGQLQPPLNNYSRREMDNNEPDQHGRGSDLCKHFFSGRDSWNIILLSFSYGGRHEPHNYQWNYHDGNNEHIISSLFKRIQKELAASRVARPQPLLMPLCLLPVPSSYIYNTMNTPRQGDGVRTISSPVPEHLRSEEQMELTEKLWASRIHLPGRNISPIYTCSAYTKVQEQAPEPPRDPTQGPHLFT